MSLEPRPDPDCGICHGEGTVYDLVPYGSTNVQMPYPCECMHTPRAKVTIYLDSPVEVIREPNETDEELWEKAARAFYDMIAAPGRLDWRIEDEEDLEGTPGISWRGIWD